MNGSMSALFILQKFEGQKWQNIKLKKKSWVQNVQ